ncbi:MAG: PSD1 and planctomycete cytochrome C domain-containing protein [Coraliomargaritaceae bacterium]
MNHIFIALFRNLLGIWLFCHFIGCSDGIEQDTEITAQHSSDDSCNELVAFNRDIRPILSENCYACHGPDEKNNKTDLRLDQREAVIASGAIIPGDAANSELIWRIHSDDPDVIMPTPDTHKKLTEDEKVLLANWIDQGAEYDTHWSYKRVERPDYPSIDAIVGRELQKRGLSFSDPADKHTLMRRVYLDIIGLPPTVDEARTFLEEDSPDAYERMVDRLLASPHYGESRAIHWLDAVRFADTVGYHGDQNRDASPYRDYVIESFNQNMPFDQFTIEQIAGDLLPDASIRQRIAASYHRLNQVSAEGGIQDKEYIKKYQAERVRTTSTVWLGSTMACAECHDHKFDPFTTKDFYSFAAFFADILEKGAWNGHGRYQVDNKKFNEILSDPDYFLITEYNQDFGPLLSVPNRMFLGDTKEYEAELKKRRANLYLGTPAAESEFEKWLSEETRLNKLGVKLSHEVSVKEDHAVEVPIDLNLVAEGLRTIAFEIGYNDAVPYKDAEFGIILEFDTGSHFISWGEGLQSEGLPEIRKKKPVNFNWKRALNINLSELKLAPDTKTLLSLAYVSSINKDDVKAFRIKKILVDTDRHKVPKGELNEDLQKLLAQCLGNEDEPSIRTELKHGYFTHHAEAKDLQVAQKAYNDFEQFLNGNRSVPATISSTPREVKVLPRGNWMDESGEVVLPATPAFLPGPIASDEEKRLTRMDLAKWLVSRENPLTARTYVNRLWAQFFSAPLSNAPEDLGLQGEYPMHPDLLDWLAAEFMDSGWDVKHLIRTIVLSRTYRQSSKIGDELLEVDPYNRLLASQSPRRLSAESIRDNALSVSGLLERHIGGASIKPYQPKGYYTHLNFPKRDYQSETNTNQYRRGVYMHWQRTFLHPMLMAFDAPGRDECTVARTESNTPMQALNLLNDPSFLEAAKSLADRILENPEVDDDQRLNQAFETVLMRQPSEAEVRLLKDYLARERSRFEGDLNASKQFLAVGMYEPKTEAPATELAAWMSVSRTLLNLNETITRY